MPAIQCKLMNVCGLSDKCSHARPHPGLRCGHCGTKCWDSNGFCNGGYCSQLHSGMGTDAYLAMCREFGRPKCVESADVLPSTKPCTVEIDGIKANTAHRTQLHFQENRK